MGRYAGLALSDQKLLMQAADGASKIVSTAEDGKSVLLKQADVMTDRMRFKDGK